MQRDPTTAILPRTILTDLSTVEILGIRAVGCHGSLPEEQSRPQPFEVDVRLDVDLGLAATSDHLDDTVDYAMVAEAVARTVELTSNQLLERLTDRIAAICVSLPAVTSAEVTLRRLRPSVPVHVTSFGVTIRRHAAPGSTEVRDLLNVASVTAPP